MKKFFAILAIATVTFASCNSAGEGESTDMDSTPAVVDSMPPAAPVDTMTTTDSTGMLPADSAQ